jgi:orotate phosphoribosyltransferase
LRIILIEANVDFSRDFIALACDKGVLRFGEFMTKAGRKSPYFFNAGLFNDGASFGALCSFYARAILASGLDATMLFGPAYKGIPLVAGTAMRLAEQGVNLPYCFNRKEAKDHGEGGTLVGAPLAGRVLILDDVISAGTSVRESVEIIRAHGATPAGVVIALDRMERGQGALSAVQEVQAQFDMPVIAVATLTDLIGYLGDSPDLAANLSAVQAYRDAYGVAPQG